MSEFADVSSLWTDSVHTMPADVDWSVGYGETWEFYECVECYECEKTTDAYGVCQTKGCERYDGDPSDSREGPMMNYAYPIQLRDMGPDEAAELLVDLPLCLIEVIDVEKLNIGEYALALTGGGMDLSWEICEAYMVLGHLPPLHFCDLPGMAGKRLTEKNRWIIEGCKRSASAAQLRAGRELQRLDDLMERMGAER